MRTSVDRLCAEIGARDVLVLARDGDDLNVIGGCGRGAGWAGIVSTRFSDEPHLGAVRDGSPARLGGAEPQQVIGPYWARTAMVVPVGESHVVVFGGDELGRVSDGELLRRAVQAVGACGDIPADKLLADELELVHALRALTNHRPETVAQTARHVATVAADALSCDIAVLCIDREPAPLVVTAGEMSCQCPSDERLVEALRPALDRTMPPAVVEQNLRGTVLGEVELVSRLTLTVGGDELTGVLVLGHAVGRPRGFTNLCLRIGRSLADAAEGLLAQAAVREELAAERDRFASAARTDPLTGLGNRIAWTSALADADAALGRHWSVIVADISGLKRTNDALGLAAGDRLVMAAADVLRSVVREDDVVVRLGGDEFGILLRDASDEVAEMVAGRIADACATWRSLPDGQALRLAIGVAARRPGESMAAVQSLADERMRTAKHDLHARPAV